MNCIPRSLVVIGESQKRNCKSCFSGPLRLIKSLAEAHLKFKTYSVKFWEYSREQDRNDSSPPFISEKLPET